MAEPAKTQYDYSPLQAEVVGVYNLYRRARLNVYFYGKRRRKAQGWYRALQFVAALGASSPLWSALIPAVAGLQVWTWISVVSALAVAVSPFLGLSERIAKFEGLHLAYLNISGAYSRLVGHIRAAGTYGEIHRSAASELEHQMGALETHDEADPSDELAKQAQARVNNEIPPETLWLPSS